MKKKLKGLLLCFVITAFVCIIAVMDVSPYTASADNKYGLEYYKLTPQYVTAEVGEKQRIYVNSTGYDDITNITYDVIKLKSLADKDNLVAENGVLKNTGYEILKDDVIVSKTELTKTQNGTEALGYYFDVYATQLCAYIFTVNYRVTPTDDIQHFYPKILYCVSVDDKKPQFSIANAYWSSGKCKITLDLSDEKITCACSGLDKITIYQKAKGSDEYVVITEKDINGANYRYSTEIDYGNYSYYVDICDNAGNATSKLFLKSFVMNTYDAEVEANVRNALADMEKGGYTDKLYGALTDEYNNYNMVVSDETSTDAQKQAALASLRTVYTSYLTAKNTLPTIMQEEINSEYLNNFSVENLESALSILDKGDTATLTLTLGKFTTKEVDKSAELEKVGMKKANNVYTITVKTISEDDGSVKKSFTNPLLIKFALSDFDEIKAVQTVYSANGTPTYYDCTVVEYVDGNVVVSVPFSAGVVNVFTYKKGFDKYWLISLALIPLAIGITFLVIGYKKMKKSKAENALKAEQTMSEKGEK